MAQDGQGHGAYVFDVGAVFAGKGSVAFRGYDEVLRGARPGTPAEVLVDLIGRVFACVFACAAPCAWPCMCMAAWARCAMTAASVLNLVCAVVVGIAGHFSH